MSNFKINGYVHVVDPRTLCTDASENGLPPGQWPNEVEYESHVYKHGGDIHASDGELMGRTYRGPTGVELTIFND